ncbi:hypothetical protein DRO55_04475 [Candidatus Bathyarchaeota archaeon]|nr:MAG: hypothetical protein DRO55_04475 [Candidatus Bathyarchaeota archaeon]
MEVLFLGTAAAEGWPALFCECEACSRARALGGRNIRTRSSILIDEVYKVDLPPDNYLHMLRYGLNLARVRYLFITHTHYDHFQPDDLLMRREPFAHIRSEEPLNIYGNEEAISGVESTVKGYPNINLKLQLVEPFQPFKAGGLRVTPLLADHKGDRKPLLYLFEGGGRVILHGYDSGWFPEETWRVLNGYVIDLAILDCTSGALPTARYHMGIDCLLRVKERMLSEGLASKDTIFVATHFSHNGGLLHDELESKLEPEGVKVAFDGLKIEV